MMNRRQVAAGALVVPFALPALAGAATPSPASAAGTALTDPDAWVRLCAERRMLHELAESSVVDGDVPDDVADFCWTRVLEIDAEIAASQPATARGLRAAMTEYRIEAKGCGIYDGALLTSLFGAALALVDEAST